MLTFTGTHLTKGYGAPNIRDMSVQGMRIVRFAGAGRTYWPIGMHSLLVADLVEIAHPELEAHALLHDVAAEICGIGDVCRPMKTDEGRTLEKMIFERTYWQIGLERPTEEEKEIIHVADMQAVNAEGQNGCGPRGYLQTQSGFKRNKVASGLLSTYLRDSRVNPNDLWDADGYWTLAFERRLRRALRDMQSNDYHSRKSG